jgi:LysM repeat protein
VRRSDRQALSRLAAPVAFLLAATVAVLLVRSALHAGDATPARERTTVTKKHSSTRPARTQPGPRKKKPRRPTATYATVAAGETLETIAAEHGTTVERLLELNPGIDPHSLHVGQRVRVR